VKPATSSETVPLAKRARLISAKPTSTEVIEPGLVLIRNFIDDDDQKRLMSEAIEWGEDEQNGFYAVDPVTRQREYNADKARGRIYDAATRFPQFVIAHSERASKVACAADQEMPSMTCTHLLTNMYTSCAGLVWHRDIYENDGSSDHPVVNLSVGASCVFAYKHNEEDEAKEIVLRSGDCLLFGGRCRFLLHSVLSIDLSDRPTWMEGPSRRFSFTFRDSPEVLGREAEFRYFRPKDHLVGQDKFDPSAPQLLPSVKSQSDTTQM